MPKEVLRSAGIALNEFLDVTVSDGVITLVKPFRHKTLEERAAEFDGKLMLDGEYDWGEVGTDSETACSLALEPYRPQSSAFSISVIGLSGDAMI